MVEGGGRSALPVVLFDGEQEISVGDVLISPMLEFKAFQLILSQKIGVSPNQISIYLVPRKKQKSSSSTEDRWKIPITGKTNFSTIAREKNSSILAVLKRSRKNRRHRMRGSSLDLEEYLPENYWPPRPNSGVPEKMLLLRRNQPYLNNTQASGFSNPYYNQMISQSEILSLNNRLQSMQIQRENHEMAMSRLNSQMNTEASLDFNSFPKIEDDFQISELLSDCIDCASAKGGETVPFHHCVKDPITRFFRSTAGPIGRR